MLTAKKTGGVANRPASGGADKGRGGRGGGGGDKPDFQVSKFPPKNFPKKLNPPPQSLNVPVEAPAALLSQQNKQQTLAKTCGWREKEKKHERDEKCKVDVIVSRS